MLNEQKLNQYQSFLNQICVIAIMKNMKLFSSFEIQELSNQNMSKTVINNCLSISDVDLKQINDMMFELQILKHVSKICHCN